MRISESIFILPLCSHRGGREITAEPFVGHCRTDKKYLQKNSTKGKFTMSRFKRVLSFILTMVMLIGMIPPLGLELGAAYTITASHTAELVPQVKVDGEYQDLTRKRLRTFKINLNGGEYHYTRFEADNQSYDYQVPEEDLIIPDGFSGVIEVRMYRIGGTNNGFNMEGQYWDDYLGVPYIDGEIMCTRTPDMDELMVTLFNSVYYNGYSLEAWNMGSGNFQAYIGAVEFMEEGHDGGKVNHDTMNYFEDSVCPLKYVWNTTADKSVTLHPGPEGNGAEPVTVPIKVGNSLTAGYIERLLTNEEQIHDYYGFYPEGGPADQRIFLGWAESYNDAHHHTGKFYTYTNAAYDGEDGGDLYAIWGYPIMFDADGGVFKDSDTMLYENGADEYLTYVADYAEWMGEDTDPASMYRYVMPDWNGYTVEKTGARRVTNGAGPNGEGYYYGLIESDGKTFFTDEGYDQNLTIPPTGGAFYPSGNTNGATWAQFRCTDADDKNNPYSIEFPEFVAIWEPSVTYYPNGGTGEMPTDWLIWKGDKLYNYEDYVVRGCTYTKENAHFTGWNTKADGTGYAVEPGTVYNQLSSSDPIVLYAQWSDNSYTPDGNWTVTLDPDGGSMGSISGANGAMSDGKLVCPAEIGQTYGEIIGTLPTPTRDGYYFEGWWFEQDDVLYSTGSSAGNIHAFEYNGKMWYKYGIGWFLDTNAKFVAPQHVTFKAKWIAQPQVKNDGSGSYTMTFNPNGGTMITEKQFKISGGESYRNAMGGLYAVPMATRPGYTLEGWYWYQVNGKDNATPPAALLQPHLTMESAANHYDDAWDVSGITYVFKLSINETLGITSNFSLYANWVKIPHECVWTNIEVIPATCEAEGNYYQGCVCGATRNVTIPIKEHSYTIPWGVEKQATCTEPRIDIYLCDICKKATTTVETGEDLGGHIWGEWYYASEEDMPTCEGTGTQTRDCIRTNSAGFDMCDYQETQTVDPHGHDYVGSIVPAFCECEEVTLYICQYDPTHRYTEVTGNQAALGHIFGNPYDLGNGYTRTECIRESDGVNPDCPHYVDTPNRYNIIYDLVLPTATYGANTPYWHTYDTETVLVNPTAPNATFAGWYLDREYTQPITAIGAQDYKAPIKIYAKWELKIELYSATTKHHLYDDEGVSLGEGKNTTLTMVYGEDLRIPYRWWNNTNVFNGWTNAEIETLGQNAIIPGYAFTANARLTASYSVNKFPIVYHDVTLGGDITADTEYITNGDKLTQSITYNSTSKNITVVAPQRTGYVATMYKTFEAAQSGTGAFTAINQNSITSNNYPNDQIDVYVVWTVNSKTLTLGRTVSTAYFIVDEAGTKQTTARTVTHTYDKDTILKKDVSPTLSADFIDMYYQGYEFVGWNSGTTYNAGTRYSEDMFKIPANSVPMAAATTIYAEWKPNEFIVEYVMIDAQTGEHIVLTNENAASYGVTNWDKITDAMKTHTFGVASARIPTLARSGYTMTKWFYADNTALNGTYKDQLGASATYYNSPWHADNPKVELREDGKYYIVVHTTATLNAGYQIKLGVNGGKFVLDGVEDTTTRTVTHTSDKDTILNTAESNLSKDFDTIYRTGYEFVGWNDGTTYNAGNRYSSEMHKIPKWSVPVADTLYAEWKPNTFPIEYYIDEVLLTEDNYESFGMTKANFDSITAKHTHTYGTATADLVAPVRTGYTMSKWSYTPGGAAISGQDITAAYCSYDANGRDYVIKVYATSTPKPYTITLDDNGGIMTNAEGTVKGTLTFSHQNDVDSDLKTVLGDVTRVGYDFVGWNTGTTYNAGTRYSDQKYLMPAFSVPAADTLYAEWKPETYDIEYYVDGKLLTKELADELGIINYDAIVANSTHTYGVATVLTRVQRTGYTSTARWSYDPSGAPIIADHTITKTYCSYDANGEDFVIKVYSVTTPDDVRVVFRTPNGTSVGAANLNAYFGIDNAWPMVDYDQTYVLPTETLRPGYHLAGFYSDTACTKRIYEVNPADFITTYNQGTTYTDYNVYVKWEVEETTVPTGSIDLGVGATGVSTEFIKVDDIRYGIYAQSYPNVTIIGDKDTTNYVPPKVEYFLVENGAMTWDEVANVSEDRWIKAENGVPFSLEGTPDGEYIMYVRLTDDQGNVNFISSQRFVIDNVAPDFVELEGGEYCFNEDLESALAGGYTFTVVEKYPDKITINDDVQTFVQLQLENDYTLPGSEGGADYTVYAKDKAGNETTVTVKIYNCHDWCDWYVENAEDCLNDGNDRRDCQRCGEVETQVRPALGHEWGETTYTWSEDGKTCTATRVCSRSTTEFCTETVDANVTSEITIPATCVAKGTTTYTATFNVDWAQTQTIKKVDIEIAPDNHQLITHEAKAPTCTEIGWDAYVTCEREGCDHSTYVVKSAIGHDWNEGEITTHPTCVEKGEKLYTCNNDNSHTYTKEIEATGHTAGETVIENNVSSTCTTEGSYDEVVCCDVCGEELSRETVVVDKLGHTPGEKTIENEVEPTCTVDGSHDEVVYCKVCGEDVSRTKVTDEALGHDWNVETEYEWIADEDGKYIKCIATRVCARNCKEEGYTEISVDETITSAKVDSSCTVPGTITYTADFVEEGTDLTWTSTQTKVVNLELLDHIYDYIVEEVITEATCTTEGDRYDHYYCSVCKQNYETKEVKIPELGHKFYDGEKSEENPHGWYVYTPATFTQDGLERRDCLRHAQCGHYETRVISAKEDTSAPVISITDGIKNVSGDPSTEIFYKNDVAIILTATDPESGIDRATYTVTKNGVVIAENDTIDVVEGVANGFYTLSENAEYVITVNATNTDGDDSTLGTYTIIVDKVVPTVEPEATESFDEIKVKVEDKYLDKVVVIANGEEVEYTPDENGYITIPDSDSETTYYTIVATDKAGNETKVSVTVKFDGEEPVPSITTDLENVNHNDGEADYTNDSDVVIIITAEDNEGGSGVDHIDYVITDENGNVVEKGVYDENNKPVLDKEGKYTVYATATDAQGNTTNTPVYIDVIVVDYTIPVINSTTNGDRSVTVNVTDNNGYVTATVNGTEVTLDENGNYIIPANNAYEDKTYDIVATDKAGNVTEIYTVTVPGDKTGPSITATDDEAAEGENNNLNDETTYYDEDGKVEITIEASDDESGIKEITYTIYDKDGNVVGEENVIYDPENKPVIETTEDGEYIVTVTVTDNAGNKTEEKLDKIIIDVTDPVIVVTEDNCSGEDYVYCVPENNTITVEVLENNVESVIVKVNGEVNNELTGKELVLSGSEEGTEYEITVTDKVGHTSTVTVVIYSTHAWNNGEVTSEPTCLGTGIMTYTCTRCGETRTEVIPATGHDWGKATYSWSDDGKSCTATRVCNNDISHVETASAAVTAEQTKAPTCAVMGETTYTATFEETWAEAQTTTRVDVAIDPTNHNGHLVQVAAKTPTCTEIGWNAYEYCTECTYTTYEEIPATDHNWDDVTYTWSEDGKSCTAKRVCKNDESHVETATAVVTSEVTTPATCVDKGTTTYTASFTVEWAQPQTTTRDDVAKDPHNHADIVKVEAKAPTCTEIGWNAYEYCTECDYTTYEEIPATDHNWDDVTYTWSEDGKSCTAKRVCKNDESHVETATAVVTSEVTTPATCVDKGTTTYTASFTVEWAQPQTTTRDDVAEDSDNHVALEQVEAKAPTCTEIGWNAYEKCDKCGYTTYVELPANGHPKKHGFKEVIVKEMTDNKDGTYSDGLYYVIEYCTVCDHVFSKNEYKLHPVAQNVESGKLYTTVNEALEDAEAGNTVKILENILDEEHVLALTEGYLDLNGWTLETYHISTGKLTHIIDSSEGNKGHLIVNASKQTINPSNCDLPVYEAYELNGETRYGYRFYDSIILQQLDPKFVTDSQTGATSVSLTFRPIIEDSGTTIDLLGDGGNDEKLKIGVVFTVTDANGVKSEKMHWICQDSLVEVVYQNTRAFMVTLTGLENYETITLGSVIMSDLGVEMTTYEKDGKIISTVNTYDISTGKTVEA